MTQSALVLSGLTIRDACGNLVVGPLDLDIPAAGTLVLIGESGSGKSLIAQVVMGLLPAGFSASGTIAVNGHDPVDAGQAGLLRLFWSRETMLLPQEPRAALDPTMRIARQIASRNAVMAPQEALASVGLGPEAAQAYPVALSGGMAQRVLVAAALVGHAPLLIADEPTKGLDAARLDQTRALLGSLSEQGRALLVITHDIALARGLGGMVAVLRDGRLVERGASRDVFSAPSHAYTRAWLEADPAGWRRHLCCCSMSEPVLAGHGLRFGFPRRPALFEGVDLHVPRGGVLAVTGPSGCGKTTLGNILLGLLRPQSGTVSWQGIDPYRDGPAAKAARRRYQKLYQDPASVFLPGRPLGRQLADLAQVVPGLRPDEELPPLLDRLKLDSRLLARRPGEVSGGEAQRLALARILLLRPDLIVADEPTSRLDPLVQRETMTLLREIVANRGLGLVLIGHDRALLSAAADEVLELGRPAGGIGTA